jgi:ABC-type bacteriocin/lantibiotic exporter with double-glycine peptidase domain
MVLAYYKVHRSERTLTAELRSNTSVGTKPERMVRNARLHGLWVYVKNDATIRDVRACLAKEVPVIVYMVEPRTHDDHYAVVVALHKHEVVLHDPYFGKNYRLPLPVFTKCWRARKKYRPDIWSWMLACSPEPLFPEKSLAPFPCFVRKWSHFFMKF